MEDLERLRDELIDGFEGFLTHCRVLKVSVSFETQREREDFEDSIEHFEEKIKMYRHHTLIAQTVQMGKQAGGGKR